MKRILVCPLDWGLGHATRCIPVIRNLQAQGAEVLIASSGNALELLRQEFPGTNTFELPPYAPFYSTSGSMMLQMMKQLPKFRRVIEEEHHGVERLADEHKINAIISDNRYGCWSSKVRSVFITHQVRPLMPSGFAWLAPVINTFSNRYLSRFEEVWIPDQPGSGMTEVFNPKPLSNQKYIGWLSRFTADRVLDKKYDIIALVSGPEPQREIFEKLLTDQLKSSGRKSLLVAGEPDKTYHRAEGNLEIVSHLAAPLLERAIQSSGIVLSRSGYSTIMDLIALGSKAIFIPTPEQTEQLFFAEYCREKKIAFMMEQDSFDLALAMQEAEKYSGWPAGNQKSGYLTEAISKLLS